MARNFGGRAIGAVSVTSARATGGPSRERAASIPSERCSRASMVGATDDRSTTSSPAPATAPGRTSPSAPRYETSFTTWQITAMPPPLNAVLFDFGDTLLQRRGGHDAIVRAANRLG